MRAQLRTDSCDSFASACSTFYEADGVADVAEADGLEALQRACFYGDEAALRSILQRLPQEQLTCFDKHGLSPLHIAAMRDRDACVQLLLDAGCDANLKSATGWFPAEEAACYKSQRALGVLLARHKALFESKMHDKLKQLQTVMRDMPDCAFQLKWDINSPILGAVLHKHLPHDTYTVYKSGHRLRIDGQLKGIRDDAKALLPNWKYGRFSILVNTEALHQKRCVPLFVNHDKKTYMAMQLPDSEGDSQASLHSDLLLQAEHVKRSRIKFSNFKFRPIKGWVSSSVREKVHGMQTVLYEAHGELMAATIIKNRLHLPAEPSFEEYLAQRVAPDVEAVVPLNLTTGMDAKAAEDAAMHALSAHAAGASQPELACDEDGVGERASSGADVAGSGRAEAGRASPHGGQVELSQGGAVLRVRGKGHGKKIKAQLWLAEDAPINQKQLLPLLAIAGSTNKYITKVVTFMETYGDLGLFPVKVVIPLLLSLRITVAVKNICVWNPCDNRPVKLGRKARDEVPDSMCCRPEPAFFEAPPDYTPKDFQAFVDKQKQKVSAAMAEEEAGRLGTEETSMLTEEARFTYDS